jgi:RNA-binding protein YlmH
LDYAKAFDKVDHEILLGKLSLIGIKGKLFEWIKNFITKNRVQSVLVNGKRTFLAELLSGVPQGSIQGPLLFLIYINMTWSPQ